MKYTDQEVDAIRKTLVEKLRAPITIKWNKETESFQFESKEEFMVLIQDLERRSEKVAEVLIDGKFRKIYIKDGKIIIEKAE